MWEEELDVESESKTKWINTAIVKFLDQFSILFAFVRQPKNKLWLDELVTEFQCPDLLVVVHSLAHDLGPEPAGWSASRNGRDHRLPHRGVPEGHQLLGIRQRDAATHSQVHHGDHGELVPCSHEAHRQVAVGQGLRQLPVHLQELAGRDRGLHSSLRSVKNFLFQYYEVYIQLLLLLNLPTYILDQDPMQLVDNSPENDFLCNW